MSTKPLFQRIIDCNLPLYSSKREESTSIITNSPKLRETIDKFGVAIIESVINEEEMESMRDGIWDYFEHITKNFEKPMNRDDPSSWRSFYDLFPKHGMLIQNWEIGHAQFLWDLRQNPKIVDIFAELWKVNSEDLLVSFDAASLSLPPETTKRGYYRGNNWLHLDQRLCDPSFQCVQSWVTAWDVNEGDGTLTVLKGSNRYFEEFAEVFDKKGERADWNLLKEEEVEWYKNKGCEQIDITCPKGSMVFWDSRTVHAGKEPLKNRKEPNIRGVGYLCYTPRSMATQASLKKKQKAFNEKRTTSHWPHRIKLFPLKPRLYGSDVIPDICPIERPSVSELGRRLAGF